MVRVPAPRPPLKVTVGLANGLASVRLAVVLMAILALTCIWATFYEVSHGTDAVQRVVYGTAWFGLLLTLLGMNVFASMMKRYPWNRHHVGFVLAHVGILLLLGGSLISTHAGLDGQLALYEGERSDRLSLPGEPTIDGPPQVAMPFQVTLLRFLSEKYPGSRMAATYESRVRIDDPEQGVSEHLISMNHPLHYRGYIFFQASYVEGSPMMSIFSVARSPGLPLVYLGTALISIGVMWMFYLKPYLARRQGLAALDNARLPILLVAALAAASPLRAGTDFDTLRTIAVQDGGRIKPLDTFARETARRVSGAKPFTGGESVAGLDPVEWVVSMLADPQRWQDAPVVRVTHAGLREAARLPAGKDRFSFHELAGHQPFLQAADAVHEKLRRGGAKLDPIEQEVANLYDTLAVMGGLFSGESLRMVAAPSGDPQAAWLSLADLEKLPEAQGQRARSLLMALTSAYRAGDREAVRASGAGLKARLAGMAPEVYASAKDLGTEVRYNTLKPFRLAWVAYLVAFLVVLASFPLQSPRLGGAGVGFAILGFAVHAYGMLLRILISGRPPVTNMYESVIWVAWGAMLFALVFEALYRSYYFVACASGLAVVCLILADNVPILDGSIEPLVPVLRDNMWLTLHVLTITLGYAAFLLAMGIGHVNLGLYFFAPRRAALLKTMSLFLYRSLQVGTLLLAVGTLLGGVWASYSWGRFWGWDPKETWALIALLGYLAVLHGRFAGWFREFGMAVGSILGFLLVLMAWYGVNFILGTGLHSYGFGAGGYAWIGGFVAFEALVIVAAFARKHRAAAAPAVALAARAVGVVLLSILLGACASAPAPVRLEASPADLQALAGEWEGEYSSAATGLSGSIVFELVAGEDHAHGDVVMMPSGAHRAYGPMSRSGR